MKVYESGNNIAVQPTGKTYIYLIPKISSRVLPFDANIGQIGVHDDQTNWSSADDWSNVTDAGGTPWGVDYQTTLDAISAFVGGVDSGGSGATKFADLTDWNQVYLNNNGFVIWNTSANEVQNTNFVKKVKRLSGAVDAVFYSDQYVEFRWLSSGQPQYRLINNTVDIWAQSSAGIQTREGNTGNIKQFQGAGLNWSTLSATSTWQYFTSGGTQDLSFNLNTNGLGEFHVYKSDNSGSNAMPHYKIKIWLGNSTSLITEVNKKFTH